MHQELFSKSAVALVFEGADGFLFAESLVDLAESQVTRVRFGYIAARMGAGEVSVIVKESPLEYNRLCVSKLDFVNQFLSKRTHWNTISCVYQSWIL